MDGQLLFDELSELESEAVYIVPQARELRATNTIERLHEEFRRRVKTRSSLPTEDAALVLLFSLVASGQINLRTIEGWRRIAAVHNQRISGSDADYRV